MPNRTTVGFVAGEMAGVQLEVLRNPFAKGFLHQLLCVGKLFEFIVSDQIRDGKMDPHLRLRAPKTHACPTASCLSRAFCCAALLLSQPDVQSLWLLKSSPVVDG
jgi:hypothetical protein